MYGARLGLESILRQVPILGPSRVLLERLFLSNSRLKGRLPGSYPRPVMFLVLLTNLLGIRARILSRCVGYELARKQFP